MLPYFRKSERRVGGDDRYRGREGSLTVSDNDWIDPLAEAFMAGVVACGIPRSIDYNGATQEGVGYFQRMIHKGKRVSAAVAFPASGNGAQECGGSAQRAGHHDPVRRQAGHRRAPYDGA